MGCWLLWGVPLVFVCCVCVGCCGEEGLLFCFSFVVMRISGVGVDFLGFGFGRGVGGGGRMWLTEKVCMWWHWGRLWLGAVEWNGQWLDS